MRLITKQAEIKQFKNALRLLLLSCLIILVLPVQTSAASLFAASPDQQSGAGFRIEYLEDKSGRVTLEQVQSRNLADNFRPYSGSKITDGINNSAWWFRIIPGNGAAVQTEGYVSVNNAYIDEIVFYLPNTEPGQTGFTALHSGWKYSSKTGGEGFIYPVFRIPAGMNQACYVQIKPSCTKNYTLQILFPQQLARTKLQNLILLGVVLGILLAMMLYNLVVFLFLRDKTYLFYVIYLFSMLLYQAQLLGIVKLLNNRMGQVLVEFIPVLGMLTIITLLVFVRSFLNTALNVPRHDRVIKTILLMSVLVSVIMTGSLRFEANTASIYLVFIITLLITSTGIASYVRQVPQARYFLIAWSTMILGRMIFAFKGWGWIPQGDLTIMVLLVSTAAESILFSLALAERIRILRLEKENALMLYKEAELISKASQIAFLQAQIKPHFLYNALNVVAALCRLDAEKARELILDLSSYLHHTFDFKNLSPFIPFEDELEFIYAYVNIEMARFMDKLKVEYDLDDTDELYLPPLIIQPLVENAIRHGIRKSEHNGTVVLRVRNKEDHFVIQVEDDGAGMSGDRLEKNLSGRWEQGTGIGIYNINRRLLEIYGKGLDINSRPGEGTVVTVIIPKSEVSSNASSINR